LIIRDTQSAIDFLHHINYYRFSGFCLAFESTRHQFQKGTTFDHIRAAYEYDRILRDTISEVLEVIELDVRASVTYHFGQRYGAFGHTMQSHFFRNFHHARWLETLQNEVRRSSEQFVEHFKTTYQEFPDLPIWVISEIMSFGALSRMCNGMLKKDQKTLAHHYGLQPQMWVSWLHHLTYVRNLCAHHARLWDRRWSIKPKLPRARVWRSPSMPGNQRLFATLMILNHLLRNCSSITIWKNEWRSRVELLIDNPPSVQNAHQLMGFPRLWKSHTLWA